MSSRITSLLLTLAVAGACGSGTSDPQPASSAIRVINGTGSALTVAIDGRAASAPVGLANVSAPLGVSAGTHQLDLTSSSGATVRLTVAPTAGQTLTAAVFSATGTSLGASVLPDTGAIVPAGKSKLRVTNLATSSGIEIWRTQPDFPSPVHIMTPFPFSATSPYLQSDPGNWEVFVTPAGGTTKLATTGAVNVPSGERRTAILMDSAGVLRFRVIE